MSAAPGSLRRPARTGPSLVRTTRGLVAPWPVIAMGSAAIVGMASVKMPLAARFLAGGSVLLALFMLCLRDRDIPLTGVFVWLALLGFVRRLAIPLIGYPEFDPLLLLGPAAAVMLWLTGVRNGERRERTTLSSLAFILFVIAFAQAFNPAGGSSGPLALLFWVGPLLWFFVGRTITRAQLERVLRVGMGMLVPVVALGLYQTFVGLLPFEYTWVGVSGFGASIFIEGFRVRPFSTLVSPQEYGYFLAFGLIVIWCSILTSPQRRGAKSVLFALALFALFMQGSRTVFLFFSLGMVIVTTLRARSIPLALVMLSFAGAVFVMGAQRVASGPSGPATVAHESASTASVLAKHQIAGFTDPASSTLPLHLSMIAQGFEEAFSSPLGHGLGSQTIAVKKTESEGRSTENDVASTFHALGLFGGFAFVLFIGACFVEAARRFRRDPSFATLATCGLLVTFVTQWWAGQLYAASSYFWLVLGTLAAPLAAHAVPAERSPEDRGVPRSLRRFERRRTRVA